MKNKIRILLTILLVAISLGIAYGFFSYYVLGRNTELITGDIYLNFSNTNSLSMSKAFPETKAEARERDDNIMMFTISGKNESTTDVFYKIMLNEGEEKEGYERFNAKDLRFDLVEINENNQEKMVVSDMSFASLNETVIYSSIFEAGINNNITRTYKLRMWIDDRVHISDTAYNADYPAKGEHAFKNHYASIKVSVKAESGRIKGYIRYNVNGEIQKQPIYEEQKTTIRQVSAETGKINYEWSTNANGTGTKYKANAELDLNSDITLYPIYISENVMNYFPTFVTNNKANIKEIYFNKSTTASLARYEEASSSLKGDIATKGHVYTWLEQDPEDNLYRMYVESDSITFLTFGGDYATGLFSGYSKVTTIEFNNVDTSRVTNIQYMFSGCGSLISLDLSNFDTRNVTNVYRPFIYCSKLENLNVSNFDTRNIQSMEDMFNSCSKLVSLDLQKFNTSKVTNMTQMFVGCSSLTNLDLSSFDTSNVTNMEGMFSGCSSLININLSGLNTRNVKNMRSMFRGCNKLVELDLSNFDTKNVINFGDFDGYGMFYSCTNLEILNIESFDTQNATKMVGMFQKCSKLKYLNLKNFNTKKVTSMSWMFDGCSGLIELDLRSFNTEKLQSMGRMFSGCTNLINLDLSSFNTKNVTSMGSAYYQGLFTNCRSLTTLDLSGFDTSNVKSDMSYMFKGCSSLTNLDLSSFNTENVTAMSGMFDGCSNLLSLNLDNFNTQNVKSMDNMFTGCGKLISLDLSSFDTRNVTNMYEIFRYCSNIEKIYVSDLWVINNNLSSSGMFSYCGKLVGQNGTKLSTTGNIMDATYAKVDEVGSPGYFWYKEA